MLVMKFYVVTETLDVYTPSSKRWSVTTGMELPLVKILDEMDNIQHFHTQADHFEEILPS